MQTPLSAEALVVQLRAHQERARGFHDRASAGDPGARDFLPEALVELSTAMEELRVTEEHLQGQIDVMAATREQLDHDQRHYQQLFEFAADALLVTDRTGTVAEANRAAQTLLGPTPRSLVGVSLSTFLGGGSRSDFLTRLRNLTTDGQPHTWRLELHPRRGTAVHVEARVVTAPADTGENAAVWWSLRPLSTQPPALSDTTEEAVTAVVAAVGDDSQLLLEQVVETAIATFRAQGSGVMLLTDSLSLRWMTTTGAQSQLLEKLQAELGEGPCVDAYLHGAAVATPDLTSDSRWPELGPRMRTHGIRAALCAPVHVRGAPIGTVNIFRSEPSLWTDADLEAVSAFANLVSRLLDSVLNARQQGVLVDQLQYALETRVVVEQAKGILMERRGVDAAAAWRLLRREARDQRRKVIDVARGTIETRRPTDPTDRSGSTGRLNA